jgi:hypothetical protein
LLIELGEGPTECHVAEIDTAKVSLAMEIATKGFTNSPDESISLKVSDFFVCTDCHNTFKEIGLASDDCADNRLAYAMEFDIPYLQVSTFWGINNCTSWFNDDYVQKYPGQVFGAHCIGFT